MCDLFPFLYLVLAPLYLLPMFRFPVSLTIARCLYFLLFIVGIFSMAACRKEPSTLFSKVPADHHNIYFVNQITETDSLNILTLEYIYNGGSVGIADFNGDGLPDVFLGGNIVPDRLYLNRGNLTFEDVSENAGLQVSRKWRSGVAVGDVNADGLPDIYICATIHDDPELRENMLLINQGLKDGVPFFVDEAKRYGVNDNGHSSNAAFLDYDKDGDLDLYILTNMIEKGVPTNYRPKINDGSAGNTDRLYRNNGDGTFTNVSREAGIVFEGYGLGLAIADINQDGWPDIYVSNDYIANDVLYINNRDGTFSNQIDTWIRHQSQFSMGNDIADINNDGLPDIITLDMLPETNLRRKTVIHNPGYITYLNNAKYGYAPQHVRNMLHVNNGNGTFSEVGQLAGLHQTEWSWSPLFADFDNDGFRDCIVTNGFPRDITDKDFSNFRGGPGGNIASRKFLLDSIPVVKVSNYMFRNNGDLTFNDVTREWGLDHPSFSNGAAFADFDNDGDLDFIINNINEEIFLFENKTLDEKSKTNKNNYLRIKLKGENKNVAALGAKVIIYYGDNQRQYHDHSLYRGYISTVEDVIHFGLGEVSRVDSVLIEWPSGKFTKLTAVTANQVVVANEQEARERSPVNHEAVSRPATLLADVGSKVVPGYKHEEDDRIDYNSQRTLPHKFSQSGPAIAVGDVNMDGVDDFYVGGSSGKPAMLFVGDGNGGFTQKQFNKSATLAQEDAGALFFDADNDGDPDLYVVSGGFEYPTGSVNYQDRLYINDGKGNFDHRPDLLPDFRQNGSCVRAADFDADGDLDLFIGGRVEPGQYPFPSESAILRNNNGKFENATATIAPELAKVGMVTDAIWSDFDNDGQVDLLVVGEFMPITFFRNTNGKLSIFSETGINDVKGWWNSIAAGDFDNDGDIDYVAGNLGQNNFYHASREYPVRVYGKDLDGNSSVDAVLTCFLKSESGEKKEFPVHTWDELNSQSPRFRKKFSHYRDYGRATIDKLLTAEEREGSLILSANHMATSYIENLGNGKFRVTPFDIRVQVSPVNGIVVDDVNNDEYLDILMVGNDYGNEVFSGRYDAFQGLVLLGNGKGEFSLVSSNESGFFVGGDAKSLVRLNGPGQLYIASQNRDSLKVFSRNPEYKRDLISPEPLDNYAEISLKDGTRKVEFYYGSGYLSQSTRKVWVPESGRNLRVVDSQGRSRESLRIAD